VPNWTGGASTLNGPRAEETPGARPPRLVPNAVTLDRDMALSGDKRGQARERQRRHRERKAAGLPAAYCGARTRAGTPCRRPAGAGTDHPGRGTCSRHGGNTQMHRAKAAREQAAAEVRVMLGSQLDIDGDDALRTAMEIAAANVAVLQAQLAEMDGAPLDGRMLDLYRLQTEAVDRLGRCGKAAIDADLKGREAMLARRQSEALVAIFERVCAVVPDLTDETRRMMVDVACEGIERLENTPSDALDAGELFPDEKGGTSV
jgi:hypothetical protein